MCPIMNLQWIIKICWKKYVADNISVSIKQTQKGNEIEKLLKTVDETNINAIWVASAN